MDKISKIRIALNHGSTLEFHGADAVAADKAIQYAYERDTTIAHFHSDDSNSDVTIHMKTGVSAVQVFYGEEEIF